jgi:hypothetical protein
LQIEALQGARCVFSQAANTVQFLTVEDIAAGFEAAANAFAARTPDTATADNVRIFRPTPRNLLPASSCAALLVTPKSFAD